MSDACPRLAERRGRITPAVLRTGFAALALSLLVAAVAATDGLDEAIPDSALFFASLRDVPAVRGKLHQLPLYELFQKPTVQAFLGEPAENFEENWRLGEGRLAGITEECFDCSTGEVALAVLASGEAPQGRPGQVLVLTIAGKRDQAEALLGRIIEDYVARGFVERRDEGAAAVEYFNPQVAEGAQGEHFFASLSDRHLIMADTRGGLEQVLAGLSREPSGALAAQVDYRAARQALGGDADGFLYLNLPALWAWWEAASLAEEADSPPPFPAPRLVHALRLDQVRVLAFAVSIKANDFWLGVYAAPASAEDLLGVFPPSPTGHQLPAWIPGDALDYLWCNLDFGLLWQTVNDTLRVLSPPDYVRFRSLLVVPGPAGEPLANLERDLIAPLGQGIWAYTRPRMERLAPAPGPAEPDEAPPPASQAPAAEGREGGVGSGASCVEVVVAVGLKDGQALAQGVERLRLQGVPPVSFLQPTEFHGQRLYTLRLPAGWLLFAPPAGPSAGPAAPGPQGPAAPGPEGLPVRDVLSLGIFRGLPEGDRLIIGPDLAALEDIVGRMAAPRGEAVQPWRLQRAMNHVATGPGTFLVIGHDLQGYAGALGAYVHARHKVPPWGGFSSLAFVRVFDLQPGLYPPDDDVLPYLDAMVTVGSRSEAGLLVKLVVLAPPDFHPESEGPEAPARSEVAGGPQPEP